MVSRRIVLGLGATVVATGAGLRLAGRDDDVLRALGARPRPTPDPADTALLRTALREQEQLRADLDDLPADVAVDDLVAVLDEQVAVLGGPSTTPPPPSEDPTDDPRALAERLAETGRRREQDALEAVSGDLSQVLASLAAGLAQSARSLGSRA